MAYQIITQPEAAKDIAEAISYHDQQQKGLGLKLFLLSRSAILPSVAYAQRLIYTFLQPKLQSFLKNSSNLLARI